MNRSIHRWVSLPIAVFMFVVAVSGIWLQVYEFGGDEGRGEREVSPGAPAESPTPQELGTMVSTAMLAAQQTKPDFSPESVTVALGQGQPTITLNGPGFRQAAKIEYNPASGEAVYTPPPPMSIRGLIVGLHTGRIGGVIGLLLVMASGIVLVVLCVTGLLVYVDMWNRRRKADKTGLFW